MSYNSMFPKQEQQKTQNKVRFGNSLPMAQKKWLKKVLKKCQEFLNKMKQDCQSDRMLQEPYDKIYQLTYRYSSHFI